MKIREMKKGEFFTRSLNRFCYLKGETQVYTDLVF